MKPILVILQIIFGCALSMAQVKNSTTSPLAPGDIFPSKIEMTGIGNDMVQFSAILPPLKQLAGAPKAYYSYFWEFGDGTFSDVNLIDRDKPKHRYRQSGNYQVRLLATNNYASGISPTVTQQFNVHVNASATTKMNSDFFGESEKGFNVKIKVNRNPKPGEDVMAYIGYRNKTGDNTSGSIVLFYNDQRFIHRSFGLTDKRTYHGESNSSLDRIASRATDPELLHQNNIAFGNSAGRLDVAAAQPIAESQSFYSSPYETRTRISSLKKKYLDYAVFSYDNLLKDEERFMFFRMQALPDIIKDTNEVISMTAMIVPDKSSLQTEVFEMTIQILVSHDPNQMHLVQNRINYRFMGKKKELTYKVEFQNIGKGPARNISLGIALPNQLNSASLKVNGVRPALVSCDSVTGSNESCLTIVKKDDSIYVVLKNIYLPGLEQNLVKNEDSTKGFIEYTIRLKKKPKKIPFSSRAAIQFDNNKPIYTNNATAKFVKGISPGIVAGYNLSVSNGNYSAKGPVQIGYVLAPYAPSRPYFQVEVYAGVLQEQKSVSATPISQNELKIFGGTINRNRRDAVGFDSGHRDTIQTKKQNIIQIIPLHFRYNFNNWISAGIGLSGQIAVSEKVSSSEKDYYYGHYLQFQTSFDTTTNSSITLKSGGTTKTFTESSIAPFVDVQVGRVRSGPFVGIRYYRQLQGDVPNRFFIYAGIKL